jgi:hypothetical protein
MYSGMPAPSIQAARRAQYHWRQPHAERFNLQPMVFTPDAGTTMEFGHIPHRIPSGRGGALVQALAQQIGKEVVIAVPPSLVVQRNEEQGWRGRDSGGCLARKQRDRAARHRRGDRRQAVEDRRAQQERLDALGLLLQNFFKEVVRDEMVAARERLDEAGGVVLSLQGKRG